ncbi:transport and Golgi organization protein 1 [Drosophila bipectinata]|uniref:transport and Golgi organization protein 1 n=1 Tax=Drosophila bipectinata TaxID=42026 RepID=UPI0038B288F9
MRLGNEKAKMQPLLSDLLLLSALAICCLPSLTWASSGVLSDKRLCADPKCEQIISTGIAKISYLSGGEGLIPFKINAPIRVLSKSAGSNMKLWGVEIGGRRGYANKDFIMEKKVIVPDKNLLYELPVVGPGSPTPEAVPSIVAEPVVVPGSPVPVEKPSIVADPLQPVLNASELVDELLTTTTSPLDVKVESIVVDQGSSVNQQAPSPTATTQAQVQLVDGTELPLEVTPAVTESIPTPVEASKLEAASAAVETKEPQEAAAVVIDTKETPEATEAPKLEAPADKEEVKVPATGTEESSQLPAAINAELEDDDFDYEEDEEDENEEANDDDVNADSNDNESLNEKLIDKKAINVSEPIDPKLNATEQTDNLENAKQKLEEEQVEEKPIEENVKPELPTIFDKKDETGSPNVVPAEIVNSTEVPEIVSEVHSTETVSSEVPKPTEATETDSEQPEKNEKEEIVPLSAEVRTEPETEKLDLTVDSNIVQPVVKNEDKPETLATSTEVPTGEAPLGTLPPLFEKSNFDNPNDYYKKLQEQQQQEKQLRDEKQKQQEAQLLEQQQQDKQQHDHQHQQQEHQQQQQQHEHHQHEEKQHEHQQQQHEHHQHEEKQPPYNPADNEIENGKSAEVLNTKQQPEQTTQHHHASHYPASEEQTTPTTFTDSAYEAVYEDATPLPDIPSERPGVGTVEPVALPATSSPTPEVPIKEDGLNLGLFATIVDTVNNFIGKEPQAPLDSSDELHRILYPGQGGGGSLKKPSQGSIPNNEEGYCARFQPQDCHRTISIDNFIEVVAGNLVEHTLLLLCVVIAAASSLFFIFVYYCFCNSSQEGELLSKLNHLERSLLASHKENSIIKHDLMTTRTKLASIEDNSFGSNDMVNDLKKQLETELYEKAKLQEQVVSLERDLDNAAEAGLELNKMLSEVLASQNGDEAFMSTVDELQRQLNEQEKIIIEINSSLAEKSRENSELQYSFTEAKARLTSELKSLQEDNYELEMEKSKLQTRLEEIQSEMELELAKALETRNFEMQRLQNQILELTSKWEREHGELQTSHAKIEALEDCLKALKKDGNLNIQDLITSAKTRGELNASHKKFIDLQSKLEQEVSIKQRLESQLQQSSTEIEQLKQDFNQSERDKLEAQTRLEVLSGYFREKENELKKELSLQETKWLQHQGENASTVETQTLMKNEIQTLKSQNDELRAEIEAQIASHKAQMGTLENRAHESWLAARQSERRCEEALAEAAGLRRKLTTMASGGGAADIASVDANGASMLGAELKTAPSPLPLPGSPLLNMPNPLPFLAAPFSPFMGLPPPFLPPTAAGGARPPPLGRMRSPPPRDRDRDRYSDYSDYDDYDDDEEDDRGMDRRRRHSGSWGRGRRDSYTHSPRTYRSLSPSDSRYNYNDTETDFSPPPSPPPVSSGRTAGSRPYSEV